MQNIKKYLTIIIVLIILIIPIVFGFYNQYLICNVLNYYEILTIIAGFLILLLFGKLIELYAYDEKSIQMMKQHDVIDTLIENKNKSVLLVVCFFLLTMVMEELIFRYYVIGFLLLQLQLEVFWGLFISSVIFSLYHIHTWFSYKNIRISIIYIGYSFFMGLFLGYILLTVGIFLCILVHCSLAFMMYFSIYKKHFKLKLRENKKKS